MDKMKSLYKRFGWSVLLFMMVAMLKAQNVTVDASIDSLQLLIGQQTKIRLEVCFDADQKMKLPVFRDTIVTGVEIIDIAKPDTQYLNDKKRLMVAEEYTITSFDSALYYLPPFEVMVDDVPYYSKSLALNVLSVPVDTLHPEYFFGPKDIMKAPFAWEDWETSIWLSVLSILLIALVAYLVIRYKDNKPIVKIVKVEPKLPPHQWAMKEIEKIKANKEGQKNDSKTYYTELTDVIRIYIKERFGFNAMEMTSSEIIERLLQEENQTLINELTSLFQTADLVKFAKHNPMINENDMNLVNAIEFINQTKVEVDPNQKPQVEEVTVEEKRSRRSKIILFTIIVILSIVTVGILIKVIRDIYSLCF